jgi:cytochrome c1
MRLKMKPRYSLIVAVVIVIPVVLLVLNTADSGSPETGATIKPSSSTVHGQAESVGKSVEANIGLTATPEIDEALIAPDQSGMTLLQTNCAQCHSIKLLEQTRKSRASWEKTLSRMERYSGLVNDTEKLMVLDHLTASDKP